MVPPVATASANMFVVPSWLDVLFSMTGVKPEALWRNGLNGTWVHLPASLPYQFVVTTVTPVSESVSLDSVKLFASVGSSPSVVSVAISTTIL